MRFEKVALVSWLDGYLNAIGSVDGEGVGFFNSVFLLEKRSGSGIEEILSDFFSNEKLNFNTVICCVELDRFLEDRLSDLIFAGFCGFIGSDISNKRRHFVFRIMDVVGGVIGEIERVYNMDSYFGEDKGKCKFVVVEGGGCYLVFQFLGR